MVAAGSTPLLEAEGVEVEIAGTPILARRRPAARQPASWSRWSARTGPASRRWSARSPAAEPIAGGTVRWSGRELGGMRGRELARLRAFVPQRMPVPAGVTVREAVTIGRSSHLRPLRPADRRRPRRDRGGDGAGRGRRASPSAR